jgi:hypothetical protein
MRSHKDEFRKVHELAASLDDVKTIVDELAEETPEGVAPTELERIKDTLEDASDAVDDVVERE